MNIDITHMDKFATKKALTLTSIMRAPKASSEWRKHRRVTFSRNKDGDRIQSPKSRILNKKNSAMDNVQNHSTYKLFFVCFTASLR
jgi:hypothetical protein